ncbi:MAG: hypothetical protein ACKO4Q_06435 [Planctomycetota bacterium]
MPLPLVLVTGFGPFEDRRHNPSRAVAAALERDPPAGLRVRACELPVSFLAAPREVERFVARHARSRPVLVLGLGVQRKGYFRFERRARGRYTTRRSDNDGTVGASLGARVGPMLRTTLDLRRLARLLRAAGAADVRISNNAGGYVCERTYHALLASAAKRALPALFLHVPPAKDVPSRTQARLVRAWHAAFAAQVSAMRGRSSGESGRAAAKARKRSTNSRTARPM